jgi:DNA-binding NarL/FixJ family response regulator
MPKPRVLLICSQDLFGESVESVLRCATELELVGPWSLEEGILSRIPEASPEVVVIADQDPTNEKAVHLATALMEQYPDLPVICTRLAQNMFRVFSTHTLPASSTDLLDSIHALSSTQSGLYSAVREPSTEHSKYRRHEIEKSQRSD